MEFEEYVEGHGPSLLRLAYLLTRDPHGAEDLTQSVLMKAYRSWRRVSRATDPHAYVRRMMVNSNFDHHRKQSNSEIPFDDLPERRTQSPDPAVALVAVAEVKDLLGSLSPGARTLLVLRYYVDLNDRQIAEMLGVSESYVRASVSRTLGALRLRQQELAIGSEND